MDNETLAFVKLGGAVEVNRKDFVKFLNWAWKNDLVEMLVRRPKVMMCVAEGSTLSLIVDGDIRHYREMDDLMSVVWKNDSHARMPDYSDLKTYMLDPAMKVTTVFNWSRL